MAKRFYVAPSSKGTKTPDGDTGDLGETFYDLGFSSAAVDNRRRFINKDGSFNVHRVSKGYQDLHIYQRVVSMSWWSFGLLTIGVYVVVNTLFALLYLLNGIDCLSGWESDGLSPFWSAFFFSVQTITTVGYGSVSPEGFIANLIAAFGAFTGLMSFALATGLLFARFSKPNMRVLFSPCAIVGPYREGEALMFRLANERRNMLTNLHVEVIAAWIDLGEDGKPRRVYTPLDLERDTLSMLPLSWTVVHPLSEQSPISICRNRRADQVDLEIMVVLECYDDTFANTVRTHYSYRFEEVIWNARFEPTFFFEEDGYTTLDLSKLGDIKRLGSET